MDAWQFDDLARPFATGSRRGFLSLSVCKQVNQPCSAVASCPHEGLDCLSLTCSPYVCRHRRLELPFVCRGTACRALLMDTNVPLGRRAPQAHAFQVFGLKQRPYGRRLAIDSKLLWSPP
jgi:hypothetical protein